MCIAKGGVHLAKHRSVPNPVIDVQDCCISSALAMETLQYYNWLLMCFEIWKHVARDCAQSW